MFLSMLAHAILRVMLGGALLLLGYRHLFTRRRSFSRAVKPTFRRAATPFIIALGALEAMAGTLFVLGAWTQIAALAAMFYAMGLLIFRGVVAHTSLPDRWFYFMVLAASLSLLITGAGAFAFDLPI